MFIFVSFDITICTKYTERSGNVTDTIGKSYRTSQNEEQLFLHQRVSMFSVLLLDSSHVCLLVLVVAFA